MPFAVIARIEDRTDKAYCKGETGSRSANSHGECERVRILGVAFPCNVSRLVYRMCRRKVPSELNKSSTMEGMDVETA